jgi:hypothetical protein
MKHVMKFNTILCALLLCSIVQAKEQLLWALRDSSGMHMEIFDAPLKNFESQFPPDLTIIGGKGLPREKKHAILPLNPSGANNYPASPACQKEVIAEALWKNSASVKAQAAAINAWANRCDAEIADPVLRHSYWPLIDFARVDYHFHENKRIYFVRATLPDGRALTGYVAMKPGNTPRPLIIAKCGALCNAEQSVTHRSFMMHLYDESPFHVLTLANNTGSDFQIENGALALGGFDEGRQLYQIAKLIRSPESPIRSQVSSVHIVGASLGGSSALFSSIYTSANDLPGQPTIQSVTAVCPVVVLKNSVRRLYFSRAISPIAAFETLHQIKDVFYFVPVIGELFTYGRRFMPPFLVYDKITRALLKYYRDWTEKEPWDLKPFVGTRIKSLDQFWEVNDFRNYISDVQVPTLAIGARNDSLVKPRENSELLQKSLLKLDNPDVDVVFLGQGNHCAFSIANGWANYSTLLREYILSHAPEAKVHWRESRRELPMQKLRREYSEQIVETTWQAVQDQDYLWLKLKIFSPFGTGSQRGENDCGFQSALRSKPYCYREIKLEVPLKNLDVETYGVPGNSYEMTALTRFANTRFSVLDSDGNLVTTSNKDPRFVNSHIWY